jgi:hypothetical protein
MYRKIGVIVIILASIAIIFQNCSASQFSITDERSFALRCLENPQFSPDCANLVFESHTKQLQANPTDILFILDESCSMNTIAEQVRDGFNSVAGSRFPPNTLMGVTYMSPSFVNTDGTFNFQATFPGLSSQVQQYILNSPGYMKLVNEQSFAHYRNRIPDIHQIRADQSFNYRISTEEFTRIFPEVDYLDSANGLRITNEGNILSRYNPNYPDTDRDRNSNPNAFQIRLAHNLSRISAPACSSSWFSPHATNADGASCLSSAVQLMPVCTGVEAGIVSLVQLLNKFTSEGKSLFRVRSNVNIILVSDTHEAGYNYFGQEGAPGKAFDLEVVQSAVLANNSSVSSIKIHGIIPLPETGNPLLEGLKYVGNLPQTDEDSIINSEGLHGFSYLPYIKGTNGIAAHAANNDWSSIASEITNSASFSGRILVKLNKKAKKLIEIKVNGQPFDMNKVILNQDAESLSFSAEEFKSSSIKIDLVYEADVRLF